MKIRSISDLDQHIDSQLAWRKREISTVNNILKTARSHEKKVISRLAVCLLYAHWEGFIKEAAKGYLALLVSRGLNYGELTENFLVFGIRDHLAEAVNSGRASVFGRFIARMTSIRSEKLVIDVDSAISARANLDSKILFDILYILGIDNTHYILKSAIIDQKLLYHRNGIAHGDYLDIEERDYFDLHDHIMQLIEDFRTDLQNAVVTERFKAQSP